MAQETNDTTFKADVLNSPIPVLVDFWAPWCGPCIMAGPVIDKVSEKAKGKARVFKLNVDENSETACTYNITSIPTVMVFKNGKVEKTMVGLQNEKEYLCALDVR